MKAVFFSKMNIKKYSFDFIYHQIDLNIVIKKSQWLIAYTQFYRNERHRLLICTES